METLTDLRNTEGYYVLGDSVYDKQGNFVSNKCAHSECDNSGEETAILNGKEYSVCSEHLRITNLGNWQNIK